MAKILLRSLLVVATVLVTLLLFEGVSSVRRAWTTANAPVVASELAHCGYDPELGWMHLPDHQVKNLYGPGLHLTTNAQRMRGKRTRSPEKPADTYRIVCLGDSYTMGYGVGDPGTYPAWMERLAPGVETVNMGLGGYGVDQCYLWYLRDGVQFETDVLLLAVIGDDFNRMLPLVSVAEQPKPILELVDGEPVATNLPVPFVLDAPPLPRRIERTWKGTALGKWVQKQLRKRGRSRSQGVEAPDPYPFAAVAERIFERLRDLSEERGQRFVVAYLPTSPELERGRPPVLEEWLDPTLERLGVPLLDLWPAFSALKPGEKQVEYALGHFSHLGNRRAARLLLEGLRELDPALPR